LRGCILKKHHASLRHDANRSQRLEDAYCESGHEPSLQEASEHVAPVMFVVGHAGQTHVHSGGRQEELDGGTQQPRPLGPQPRLNVQLQREEERIQYSTQ